MLHRTKGFFFLQQKTHTKINYYIITRSFITMQDNKILAHKQEYYENTIYYSTNDQKIMSRDYNVRVE